MSNIAQNNTMSKPFFGVAIPVRSERKIESSVEDFNLYEDIIVDTIPAMPEDLVQYDYGVTNAVSKAEAEAVFLVWLKQRQDGQPFMGNTEARLACKEVDDIDMFFPEYPIVSDFPDGETNFEYRRMQAVADINTAKSKRECSDCEFRVQCLTRSITNFDVENGSGVWGGWGQSARYTIQSKFNEIRRYYQAGRRSMEYDLAADVYVGMPIEQVLKMEQRASELVAP